jgi:hypothetical protein
VDVVKRAILVADSLGKEWFLDHIQLYRPRVESLMTAYGLKMESLIIPSDLASDEGPHT